MNTMSHVHPEWVTEPALATAEAARGCLTGVSLADVRRLRLPQTVDPFGYMRPPLDQTALELSLELAYMTYTLDLDPWMRAGWTDISIQVDNHLQSGVTVGESESVSSERIRNLMNVWKVTRARMALKEHNPVAQIMSALRQRERSDTIKAVTMIHPAANGHYVVAIGFMGTGSRFYDWFSNFRFTSEDGFHKGFRQLTEYFEQSADRILFPETGAALGFQRLTLRNVLAEMRAPDSRFSLWMAGHSQGGAVMQVFCHRLLTVWDVLPRHIVGYGFASPTTAVGSTGRDAAAYPLYHIINSDDLVPRVGALKHLGMCLEYPADQSLRDVAYGWSDEPAEVEDRMQSETMMGHILDTPTMLETIAAFCQTIIEEKTEDSLNVLVERRWPFNSLDKAFLFAGEKTKESLTRLVRYAKVTYRSLAGRRMSEAVVAQLMDEMRPIVREYTVRKLLGAFRDRFYPPHMLCRPHLEMGSYRYIVQTGSLRLQPYVWEDEPDSFPRRRFAEGMAVFTPAPTSTGAANHRCRTVQRVSGKLSPRSRGIGAQRARRIAETPGRQADCRRRVTRITAKSPGTRILAGTTKHRWGMRKKREVEKISHRIIGSVSSTASDNR